MEYKIFEDSTYKILERIRETKPLVHHITNYVVMNSTANITLAIGASPIMAHAHDEMEAMQAFSGALNINIGTLDEYWIESMIKAGRAATKNGTPIILDPVGSGATELRTQTTRRLLKETNVTVIRGNASEIMSLSEEDFKIQGVDSMETVERARRVAIHLARTLKKVVAVTGPIDLITNGETTIDVANGDPMFGNVTGTGCAATATISCFNAVEKDPLLATAAALAYYGLAGEIAAKNSSGPGSFQVALYDALFNMTSEDIINGLKVTIQ